MKRILRLTLLGSVALGMLGFGADYGWKWWTVGRFVESTDNAYVQADIVTVASKVAGYVKAVHVTENQAVKAGDILAVIDDEDFAAKVAEAKAAVEARRAAIVATEKSLVHQRAMIQQAEAGIVSSEADRERTRQDLARYRNLASSEFVSRQKLEGVEADARKTEAASAKSRAALTAEKERIAMIEADRRQAEAALKQAEAALATAEIARDDTVIRAATDGVVGNRTVQVGQLLKPGSQLMVLVPLPQVHVVANFKETQLRRMRPGQKVALEVDAFPGRPIEGRVDSFAPASGSQFSLLPPENASGNFTKIVQRLPVRIAVPADNALAGLIRPGLSVVASVDTRDTMAEAPLLGSLLGSAMAANK
jgi:membrane fusion protein (multidrug efflux system)